MKSRFVNYAIAMGVLFGLTVTFPLAAQNTNAPKSKHQQYKLYDFGTFGGPDSHASTLDVTVTGAGSVASLDTSLADPFNPNCFEGDCFVVHSALMRHGQVSDIGALPGNSGLNSSFASALNNAGLVAGGSETGAIDPSTGYPEVHAVIWQDQVISDLGTFGGAQSFADGVNNRGQVIGSALNDVPDPYSYGTWFPGTTQARGFVWEKGVMQDLGTLGGPDTYPFLISNNGKITGTSYINNDPSPITGVPPTHPFLWDKGKMIDLGSYGGDISNAYDVNNKGQVVGEMTFPGDQTGRAFFSDNGVLIDPGDLGGSDSNLVWLNEAGDAAGAALTTNDQFIHVTLWTKGHLLDLGAVGQDPCAEAQSINARQQIVGFSGPCTGLNPPRGFLWENGNMVDLNPLIENPSGLQVYIGFYISDDGQIYAQATDAQNNNHTVVLVPDGACASECEKRIEESNNWKPNPSQLSNKVPAHLGGVPGLGKYNPLVRRLDAHKPGATPAESR
jgi:probable HAF family extracellular repeat protein